MSQCERCGATNEPASRFCVSCGSPLVPLRSSPDAASTSPPKGGSGAADGSNQSAVVRPSEDPPSSSLPFAETAAPPTREEYERYQAAAARHGQAPAAAYHSSSPPSAGPTAPPAPHPGPTAPAQQATAAMPGYAQDPEEVPQGAPRILAGFVISFDIDPLGRFWPLYQGRNSVGREGAVQGLDVPIAHPTTSSRHAVFLASARPGRLKIEDSGSTNGTFVNDARLSPGQRVELRDGDRVRFGLFSAMVKIV